MPDPEAATASQRKSLEKLDRSPPTPSGAQSFERREEMKSALDRQQELTQKLDEAARQLRESLEQAAERQAFDEQLTSKLREMMKLMQDAEHMDEGDILLQRAQGAAQGPRWRLFSCNYFILLK